MPSSPLPPVVGNQPREIVIRRNLSRSSALGFGAFWCLFVLGFVVGLAILGTAWVVFPIVLLVVGVTIMYRILRLGVVGNGAQLVISNLYWTYRLPRDEIQA